MTSDLSRLIPRASHYWLINTHIPLCLLDRAEYKLPISAYQQEPILEDLVAADIELRDGLIARVVPAGTALLGEIPTVDCHSGLVWPCFADLHTHLDKGHVWYRMPNSTGTFSDALSACQRDQDEHWRPDDLYRRMEFGLRCAYAHGTKAVRTHLDCFGEQAKRSLDVFSQLREEWRDRMIMQAVSLVSLDYFLKPEAEQLADWYAEYGGVLGGVAYMNPELDLQVERVFQLAQERGLDLDFHVDESTNPDDVALRHIAEMALKQEFSGNIVCGHCCSLSVQSTEVAEATMDAVQRAGIGIVSLPMCNLYLQDRMMGRMPRLRGVTLLPELKQRGIPVAIASDNCRDPFYAYGDHDGWEVFQQAVRIGHLDRPFGDWPRANTWTAADLMQLEDVGRISEGNTADLIVFKARNLNELVARSQHDRLVLRKGQPIDTTLPDYAELDDLMPLELG